jgi:hypothetical protein
MFCQLFVGSAADTPTMCQSSRMSKIFGDICCQWFPRWSFKFSTGENGNGHLCLFSSWNLPTFGFLSFSRTDDSMNCFTEVKLLRCGFELVMIAEAWWDCKMGFPFRA